MLRLRSKMSRAAVPWWNTMIRWKATMRPFALGTRWMAGFLITEVLSRSGMGTIFKAEDTQHGNALVAVKVPHLEYESDPDFFSRFQREERIGLELNHPFILKFIPVQGQKSRPLHRYGVSERLHTGALAQGDAAIAGKGRAQDRQPDVRRPAVHARPRDHPPRPEAPKRDDLPRPDDSHHGLRHRPGRQLTADHPRRQYAHHGHAGLHGAGAGQGQARRQAHGHL